MSRSLRFIALFLGAGAFCACSGKSLPLGETNHSSDGGPTTCQSAGGQCVGIAPSSCQNGTWLDAHQYSCGGGVGVGCCLSNSPPPDGGPDGASEPTCASIGGTCTGVGQCAPGSGHLGPATSDCTSGDTVCCIPESACGGPETVSCCSATSQNRPICLSASSTQFTCLSGYTFCDGGSTNACVQAGGQCVGLTPSNCQNGTWGDANQYSCGGGVGVGCCLPTPPPPDGGTDLCAAAGGQCLSYATGCPNGTFDQSKQASCTGADMGCCIPNPPPPPPPDGGSNTCEQAGGQCVAVSPSACQNGTWGDANQYSCGGGIGVGCCLPSLPPGADGGA